MDNSITNVATILHKKKYLPLSIFCITSSLATLMLPSTLYAQECISGAADIGVSNVCGNMGWTSTTITHPFGGGSLNYFSPIANNSGNYTFTMQGGDLTNNLILGLNDSGSNNILILNSDTEIKINKLAISAGGANNNSSLSGNKVYIGYKDQGINESDNMVNVIPPGGTASLNEAISGASAFGAGAVSNNAVYISSKVSAISVIGGLSLGGNIKNNSVIMNGGKVTAVYGGLTSIGVATGNFTIINNGNVTKAFGAASTYGEVKNNFLTINEGNVDKAYGGSSISSHATNNTVTINGGIVSEINGGFIDSDLTSSNPAVSLGSATGNSVIINGGTLRGTIYGGNSLKSKTGFATGNFVTIGGTNALDMSEVTQLRGGNAHNTQDGRTGNSLEISRNIVMNTTASEVSNFNTYSFQITDAYNANSPFLTAKNIELGTNAIIEIDWEGVAPSQGDIIPLWTAITSGTYLPSTTEIGGFNYDVDVEFITQSNTTSAEVKNVKASVNSESFTVARLGSIAFINQAAGLISGQGIKSAQDAVRANTRNWIGFATLSSSESAYDVTGHDLDVNGISSLIGLARSISIADSGIIFAGFFESGTSSVDNLNKKVNTFDDGNGDYYGVGVLARYDLNNIIGFYSEGFLRSGILENEFSSDVTGVSANFDDTNSYFGAGILMGYKWTLFDTNWLDIHGGYIWDSIEGSEEIIAGALYKLDDINSHRAKIGVKYEHALNKNFISYIGTAFEHEFDGNANGTVGGTKLKTLSLSGSTGILQTGLKILTQAMTIDFNLTGYDGQRTGLTGNFRLKYGF